MAYLRGKKLSGKPYFINKTETLDMKLNKKGQNLFVEYATTFFLVVAIITTMATYVRRILQGRTLDALHHMASTVRADYPGTFRYQYEPYYSNSLSIKYQEDTTLMTEEGAYPLGSGIVTQIFDHTMSGITNQMQLAPAYAD